MLLWNLIPQIYMRKWKLLPLTCTCEAWSSQNLLKSTERLPLSSTWLGHQRANAAPAPTLIFGGLRCWQRSFSCFIEGLDQQSPRTSGNCLWPHELQWPVCPVILVGLKFLCPFEKRICLGVSECKILEFLEKGFFGVFLCMHFPPPPAFFFFFLNFLSGEEDIA